MGKQDRGEVDRSDYRSVTHDSHSYEEETEQLLGCLRASPDNEERQVSLERHFIMIATLLIWFTVLLSFQHIWPNQFYLQTCNKTISCPLHLPRALGAFLTLPSPSSSACSVSSSGSGSASCSSSASGRKETKRNEHSFMSQSVWQTWTHPTELTLLLLPGGLRKKNRETYQSVNITVDAFTLK